MDGNRFDDLTRAFGAGRTRRGVLKGIGAAALSAVGITRLGGKASAGGGNSACAHWCHANFSGSAAGKCTSDAAHGTGACYQCGPASSGGMQLCGGACIAPCTALDPCHVAGVCNPATQSCTNPNAADSTPCDDGNLCNGLSTCQSGVCTAGTPVVCDPPAPCFDAGVCDPATGICAYAPSVKGTPCSDGQACTVGDICDGAGNCVSGTVSCPDCQTCDAAGNCGPDGSQNGAGCTGNGDPCFKHTCADGTCIDTPITCSPPDNDPCHIGVCAANGTCGFADAPAGTPCAVANGIGTCQAGVCQVSACNAGFANCDNNSTNGCETNTAIDPNNCGGCGHACPGGEPCVNGVCQPTCADGIKNGTETDVDCGGGTCPACANGKTCNVDSDCQSGFCNNGVCAPPCPKPASDSTFYASCFNISESCTDGVGTLHATCKMQDQTPVSASITVNSCASQGYEISNCNGTLKCGRLGNFC